MDEGETWLPMRPINKPGESPAFTFLFPSVALPWLCPGGPQVSTAKPQVQINLGKNLTPKHVPFILKLRTTVVNLHLYF